MKFHRLAILSLTLMFRLTAPSLYAQHFTGAVDRGVIDDSTVDESSGVCASRTNAHFLWTHNDSGDQPRIFAMDDAAHVVGIYYLKGAQNRDWEDICAGRVDGVNYLFIGEIGDNAAQFPQKVIYVVPEPTVQNRATPIVDTLRNVERITFEYPDGPRDAETLMFDSQTRDLYIVSKREDSVRVYVLQYPQSRTTTITARHVATIPYTFITAGDISPDGTEILLKDYSRVYYFERMNGQSIADALLGPVTQEPYAAEPQGEGVCFASDASGFYTTSEKSPANLPAHLYYHPRVSSGVDVDTTDVGFRIDSVAVDATSKHISVNFTADKDLALSVQVSSITGKSILVTPHLQYRAGSQQIRLETRGLSAGTYLVRLLSQTGTVVRTFNIVH